MTVTSSSGTITTLTQNVTVLGASSVVAAVPSDSVWFATTPVDEYTFVRSASGLAAQTWDGASWLEVAVPGQPAAAGRIAALSYPDPAADDAMTPHAYFRAADGSLAQTYLGTAGWVTQDLPGQPADNSTIVATTTAADGPAVFYVDSAAAASPAAGAYVTGPRDTLPGADAFENAAASSTSLAQQRVIDLAYYAVHGTLPPGVTSVPAASRPVFACSGSPS